MSSACAWQFERLQNFQDRIRDLIGRGFRRRNRPRHFAVPTLELVCDHENLLDHFWNLAATGGPAPGVDGVRFEDISPSEAAAILRELSRRIREGTYEPAPSRLVHIPKPGNRGFRGLRIQSVFDRVVAAAVAWAVSPLVERQLKPCCYAYRLGRSALQMLADIDARITRGQKFVIAQDDVSKAFDNVRVNDTLDDLQALIPCPRLLNLAEVVLRGGGSRKRREEGIDQGNALSPILLNKRLHEVLDKPISSIAEHPALHRYSDNIVYACRTVTEGEDAIGRTTELLQTTGLKLKGEDHPIDIRERGTETLGFLITHRGDRLHYGIGKEAMGKLTRHLQEAHNHSNPPEHARALVRGWMDSQGPTFESQEKDQALRHIRRLACREGFRESINPEELQNAWTRAGERWNRERALALRRISPASTCH